jgi:hypothetical protein
MTPVTFSCEATLPFAADVVMQQNLDVNEWPGFAGYGPIPEIKEARFEVQTPEVVGSRIRVTNRDGSSHVEEIVLWQPPHRLKLVMSGFSPPLSRLASRFEETWELAPNKSGTYVVRTFALHAKSLLGRIALVPISWLLRGAVQRHMRQMREKHSKTTEVK